MSVDAAIVRVLTLTPASESTSASLEKGQPCRLDDAYRAFDDTSPVGRKRPCHNLIPGGDSRRLRRSCPRRHKAARAPPHWRIAKRRRGDEHPREHVEHSRRRHTARPRSQGQLARGGLHGRPGCAGLVHRGARRLLRAARRGAHPSGGAIRLLAVDRVPRGAQTGPSRQCGARKPRRAWSPHRARGGGRLASWWGSSAAL